MSRHSLLFSPSGSSRWMNCPASAVESLFFEDTTSPEAAEGTLAHDVAAFFLMTGGDILPKSGKSPGKIMVPIDGVMTEISYEMARYVQVYLDNIRNKGGKKIACGIEETLDLSEAYGLGEGSGEQGTADYFQLSVHPDGAALWVDDLKYGKGVKVKAKDNTQLLIYAAGVWSKLRERDVCGETAYDDDANPFPFTKIILSIHQVRLREQPDVWEITFDELKEFISGSLQPAVKAVKIVYDSFLKNEKRLGSKEAALKGLRKVESCYAPGEKQCRWCRAKCPSLAKFIQKDVIDSFEDLTEENVENKVVELEDRKVGEVLPKLDIVIAWVNAVREAAYKRAMSGTRIPGHKLVLGRKPRRGWKDEKKAEEELRATSFRVKDIFTQKLKSPTQIEKLCQKGNNKKYWVKIQKQIHCPDAKPVLVPADDDREEYSIAGEFEDITQQSQKGEPDHAGNTQ